MNIGTENLKKKKFLYYEYSQMGYTWLYYITSLREKYTRSWLRFLLQTWIKDINLSIFFTNTISKYLLMFNFWSFTMYFEWYLILFYSKVILHSKIHQSIYFLSILIFIQKKILLYDAQLFVLQANCSRKYWLANLKIFQYLFRKKTIEFARICFLFPLFLIIAILQFEIILKALSGQDAITSFLLF